MATTTKTVLIVDDDEDIRELTAKIVETRGYQTLSAANGAVALDVLRRDNPVHLLILDVMMPVMDGFQTLEEVRQLPNGNLPVVMLTARSEDEDVITGYAKGADYYLVKPLRPQTLMNIVDFLIGDLSPEEKARIESQL